MSDTDSSADDAEEALHSIGAIVADAILAEVYDTEQKDSDEQKKKHSDKPVRWRKRDHYGVLIPERPSSSAGVSRSSSQLNPRQHDDDRATTSTEGIPFEVQEAQQIIDLQLQLLNESLMEDPFQGSEATPAVSRTWEMRQTLSDERWEIARPQLLELMLAADKIPNAYSKCSHCKKKQTAIRCRDCLPKELFCSECDVQIHKHFPLHNRDSLLQGFYKPIPPTCYVSVNDDGAVSLCEQACLLPVAWPSTICSCSEEYTVGIGRHIILVTIDGRYDLSLPSITCNSCSESWTPGLKDLQASGYWPGHVVNFQTIYTIDVFTTFEEMKLTAPGLSRQAFVKMLDHRSSSFGRRDGTISGDSLQRSFLEWTYCRCEKEKLLDIQHFSCPACPSKVAAISIDGNRKMYRFSRTTGMIEKSAFFEGAFLAKDKEVAEFVETVRTRVQPVSGKGICGKSQWRAARETSKKSASNVDEEGVEVAVCRHGILFKALNMFRDLQPLLQNKPFLSVMHAKSHAAKCEVQWGGWNQEGAGLTVGEEVEQVNSFLSRVALTTKYMTKSARTDMITIQARGWNVRKKKRLHSYLSRRYVKIIKRTIDAETDLHTKKRDLNITDEELLLWIEDVRNWAISTPDDLSPTEGATGLQHMMESLALSIHQRQKHKYSQNDSNKARQRIRSKIQKEKKQLVEAIALYNGLVSEEETVGSVDTVLAEGHLWPWDNAHDISLKTKKMVFDKVMLLHRLREEDPILVQEMQQHWLSLCTYSKRLQEDLSSDIMKECLPAECTALEAYEGLRCIIKEQLDETRTLMTEVHAVYKSIVDRSVLHQVEEVEQEEEQFLEYIMDSSDDSDTDSD